MKLIKLWMSVVIAGLTLSDFVVAAEAQAGNDFVRVENGQFIHQSKEFYFVGSNFYRLGLSDRFYGQDKRVVEENGTVRYPFVDDVFQGYQKEGIKVIRLWGFSCESDNHSANPPLLTIDGVQNLPVRLNEPAFEKMDYVIAAAADHGIKLILPLVNFEHEYCGMEWWVKHVTGSEDKHDFYTNDLVWKAYSSYVASVLKRQNRYTGKAYRDDPTIMAIEVANEPHTKDYYECISQGFSKSACQQGHASDVRSGQLVHDWLVKISSFVKELSPNHLVSSGEEGYLASLQDLPADCRSKHQWIHNGSKGVDFVRNAGIKNIDFLTVHLYPDNWNIPTSDLNWFDRCVIQHRAEIAKRVQKPIILEETGFSANPDGYGQKVYKEDRPYYLSFMLQAVTRAGFSGTLVWQAVPLLSDGRAAEFDDFTFSLFEPSSGAEQRTPAGYAISYQVACMRDYAKDGLYELCTGICPKGTSVDEDRMGIDARGQGCFLPPESLGPPSPYPVCDPDAIINDDAWGWTKNAELCLAHPVSAGQFNEFGGCSCSVD